LEGLLLPGKHKTLRGIAKRVNLPEDRVQRFISSAPWDFHGVQDWLNREIPPEFRDSQAALVVDEVGILKSGEMSVGVKAQYSGAAGKIANCQMAVDCILAVPGKERNADQRTWPLGMGLYVPQDWAEDPAFRTKRKRVGLPTDFVFKTKNEIAREILARARLSEVPHCCTVADAGYGDDGSLRKELRAAGEAYILGVTPSELRLIPAEAPLAVHPYSGQGRPASHLRYAKTVVPFSATELAAKVSRWSRIHWAEGTKARLSGKFYAARVRVVSLSEKRWASDEVAWLLLEKRSDALRAYLCWGVDDWSIEKIVAYAHLRWTIEQFHREAKQELALDQFEGRSWGGWHHHVTMVLLAYAFIAMERVRTAGHTELPPFPQVVRALVVEKATQIAERQGLNRQRAKRMGKAMVRGLTDW
jgi:SRSO17 transposase